MSNEDLSGWGESPPGVSTQCVDGYCDYNALCKAYAQVGEACDAGNKCNPVTGHCDIEGGVSKCAAYLKNGDPCTSDAQCGGSNPPMSIGQCSSEDKTCYDLGDAVVGAIATGLGIIIII